MNSKQINFFSVKQDIKNFEEYFIEKSCVLVKLPLYNKDNLFISNNLTIRQTANEWMKVYITKEEFYNSIKVKYIEEQGYYLIDEEQSSVVEFLRPLPDQYTGFTQRSRFYFIKAYYNNDGILVKKDKSFIEWAETLVKGFANKFLIKTIQDKNFYYTESVLEMISLQRIKDKLPLNMYFKLEE